MLPRLTGRRLSPAPVLWLGLVVACSWLLSLPAIGQAAHGGKQVLPLPGKLNTSGVQVVVDTRWVDGHGYHPVRIEIIPLRAPAIADRQFRVVLKPLSYDGRNDSVSQIVEMAQGSTKAVATVLVPQRSIWHGVVLEVYEDGQRHDDLSGDHLAWPRAGNAHWNEPTPGILVIDSKAPTADQREILLTTLQASGIAAVKKLPQSDEVRAPDIRNLLRSFQYSPYYGNYVVTHEDTPAHAVEILNELKDNSKGDILPPSELPDRWLGYSTLDLIFVSLADLAEMKEKQPATLRAVADWNRTGRTLIVYDVGKDFENLKQVESLLELAPLPPAQEAKLRGWQPAKPYRTTETLRGMIDDPNAYNPMYPGGPGQPTGQITQDPPAQSKWNIVTREQGLGQVLAIDGHPFPAHHAQWVWLLNSIRGEAWNPTIRNGSSQQQRNEEFWNFLIPGTGQAPVLSFLVFISLFVVFIGPINYYLLNRQGRLYLLLVTVPASALLVTGGLFVYAVFTDGLGVKSRVRSFTTIDQHSGNTASLSRQAYYASIAPSQGLYFRNETAIHTYDHQPDDHPRHQQGAHRFTHWSDDAQQLKSGYISSRTLSQMFVTTAGKTKAKLHVGQPNGDTLTVQNELQMPLSYLVVCDADGKHFAGEKIPLGEAKLKAISSEVAARELSKRMSPFEPSYPEGYNENMHNSNFRFWGFGSRYYSRYNGGVTVHQATSQLERNLFQFNHLGGNPMAARSYVALSETAPAVPLGAEQTRQQLSLHVTKGSYQVEK